MRACAMGKWGRIITENTSVVIKGGKQKHPFPNMRINIFGSSCCPYISSHTLKNYAAEFLSLDLVVHAAVGL